MNPYKDLDENLYNCKRLTYEDIATKLLQDQYFLTALELHTELLENGRELPQLREFFSNPGNFEQHVSRASELNAIHRTPSQATLDSLDTARYSEDGAGERCGSGSDVAVLEFELRKARETINALRANLTQFADGQSALEKSSRDQFDHQILKPHERQALNFLINEYLLIQDYKLTSITFSDENPDQDFEDWDDVGLNIPRPSGLISLFRGNEGKIIPSTCDAATEVDVSLLTDFECQTEVIDECSICVSCQTSFDLDTDWNHELIVQAKENLSLKQKITALETEKLNFQKLYDAAIVSLNALTTPVSESKCLEINMPEEKLLKVEASTEVPFPSLTSAVAEEYYGSNTSTHSATPEFFELIDEKNVGNFKKESSNTSSFDRPEAGSIRDSPMRRISISTLDETLSINDIGEWTRVHYDIVSGNGKEIWIDSCLPNSLKVSLMNWCYELSSDNTPLQNDLLLELVNSDKPVTMQTLLTLVSDTLPRIIPHTLVSRRCEAVALIVCTIHLLSINEPSNAAKRSRLLQLLLTLMKKPDKTEARIICQAACLIVKWGNIGEVLSCIAELLASRSIERRILASQICLYVAPYVSVELCTSLLLSLVTLMCEASEPEMRASGLKTACLICSVADHKYEQLENIFFSFLSDSLESNVKNTLNVFAPVIARSALITGKFSTNLYKRIMTNLSKCCNDQEWKNISLWLQTLIVLVTPTLAYVVNTKIVKDFKHTYCDNSNYLEVSLEGQQECFSDLRNFISDETVDPKMLIFSLNHLIKENPDVRWTELEWFISIFNNLLEIAISNKITNQASVYDLFISLINCYSVNFGVYFLNHIIKPKFIKVINELETNLEQLLPVSLDQTIIIGIYLSAILPVLDNKEEFTVFLQKWIVCISMSGIANIFTVPLKWFAKHRLDYFHISLQLIREIVASSCESANGVSVRIYISNLITDLSNMKEINESSIESHLLPAIVALMHDNDVTVRESAIQAWGGITRVCMTRGLACETHSWVAIEAMLNENETGSELNMTAREAGRAAEALALLILPSVDSVNSAISEKAVLLLCTLCHIAPLSSESLSALVPGLQVAAHHARKHSALIPALRKLEESLQAPALIQYKHAVEVIINNLAIPSTHRTEPVPRDNHPKTPTNLLVNTETVGRRVTQMFQQSKNNMNLPNIFKKKT